MKLFFLNAFFLTVGLDFFGFQSAALAQSEEVPPTEPQMGQPCDANPLHLVACDAGFVCQRTYQVTTGRCIEPLRDGERFCYYENSRSGEFYGFNILKRGGTVVHKMHENKGILTVHLLETAEPLMDIVFKNYLEGVLQSTTFLSSLAPIAAVDYFYMSETVECLNNRYYYKSIQ
jgi:hypothetical protein